MKFVVGKNCKIYLISFISKTDNINNVKCVVSLGEDSEKYLYVMVNNLFLL